MKSEILAQFVICGWGQSGFSSVILYDFEIFFQDTVFPLSPINPIGPTPAVKMC
jgi:hypothetical protein